MTRRDGKLCSETEKVEHLDRRQGLTERSEGSTETRNGFGSSQGERIYVPDPGSSAEVSERVELIMRDLLLVLR